MPGALAAFARRMEGFLGADDLATHRSQWVEPLRTPFAGRTVMAMAPTTDVLLRQGASPQEAIELPRWRHDPDAAGEYSTAQGGIGVVLLEGRFPEATAAGLRAIEHEVRVIDGWTMGTGGASIIRIDPESGCASPGPIPAARGTRLRSRHETPARLTGRLGAR